MVGYVISVCSMVVHVNLVVKFVMIIDKIMILDEEDGQPQHEKEESNKK